jgi:hypothetical protein
MSWKEKWTFIAPKAVPVKIEDDELKFYPVCVSSMFVIKTIAAPIARALASIFQSEENDVGVVDEVKGTGVDGEYVTRKKIEPVSMELARFRLDQKQHAIEEAVDTIFDPKNSRTVMRIVMDSMREDFDRNKSEEEKDKEAVEVLNTIDASMFYKLLMGLYAGNKTVFGPLASMVAQSKGLIQDKVRGLSLVEDEEEVAEESQPETTG